MNPTATLSDVVGPALAALGLSDRDLEAKTGISRATLKRRLADGSRFTIAELERIAAVLDIPTSELVIRAEAAA